MVLGLMYFLSHLIAVNLLVGIVFASRTMFLIGIQCMAWFVKPIQPWFIIGSGYTHGTEASVFAFGHDCGRTLNYVSFRWYFTMI